MIIAVRSLGYLCGIACTVLVAFAIFWLVDGTRDIDWPKVYITGLVLGGLCKWLTEA